MENNKITLVVGASSNPERYAYKATKMLVDKGIEVILLGMRPGEVDGIPIQQNFPKEGTIHTVTLYVGPQNQAEVAKSILALSPKRVIFNPGTEEKIFMERLESKEIEVVEACTLVLLSTNQY